MVTKQFFERGTVSERSIRMEIYFGFAVGGREVYQKSEIY